MKLLNRKLINLLILLLLILVIIIPGCKKSNTSEQSAQTVLDEILSSTVQEFDNFNNFCNKIVKENIEKSGTNNETGISSTNGLKEYFQEQYGHLMTDECLEKILENRSCAISMKLAQQYSSDILVEKIEITKRSEEQNVYDYNADLITSIDNKKIASATGTITMIYDTDSWKASFLTIKITDRN